jgi:TrmH family RNA methyltransferase
MLATLYLGSIRKDSRCRKIEALPPLSELNKSVVVLVRPRNPLNIGAAARAMSNFGVSDLRLVNPYCLAFREARSAVGAAALLKNAEEFTTVADAVADCSLIVGTTAIGERSLQHPPRPLDEEAGKSIRSALHNGRVALLFGSEKTGLSNDDFSHCHWLLNIPTREENISMNLGQAVAVCLYEVARKVSSESDSQELEPAAARQNEEITQGLMEALRISGYVKPGTDAMFEKKTRQLILHFGLKAYDAKLLLGMVRQIVWKLRQLPKG